MRKLNGNLLPLKYYRTDHQKSTFQNLSTTSLLWESTRHFGLDLSLRWQSYWRNNES